jgi:hypothetical protein
MRISCEITGSARYDSVAVQASTQCWPRGSSFLDSESFMPRQAPFRSFGLILVYMMGMDSQHLSVQSLRSTAFELERGTPFESLEECGT